MASSPKKSPRSVGFIGLGAMGYPMAGHIARKFAEGQTRVWNRNQSVAEQHAQEHGSSHCTDESPDTLFSTCDVVVLCLPTSQVVAEIVGGARERDMMQPDLLVIDCTSGDPTVTRSIAASLPESVAMADAPVSGGPGGAKAGMLATMVGVEASWLPVVREVLGCCCGKKMVHVGPVGSGHAVGY